MRSAARSFADLREGDRPAEGATVAVLNAFAEHPDAQAVVGQVRAPTCGGRPTCVRYRPPQPYRGNPAPPRCRPPSSGALLADRARAALAGPRWAHRLLQECGENAPSLNRTVAHVPSPRPLVRPFALALARRVPRWMADFLKRCYRRLARSGVVPR